MAIIRILDTIIGIIFIILIAGSYLSTRPALKRLGRILRRK